MGKHDVSRRSLIALLDVMLEVVRRHLQLTCGKEPLARFLQPGSKLLRKLRKGQARFLEKIASFFKDAHRHASFCQRRGRRSGYNPGPNAASPPAASTRTMQPPVLLIVSGGSRLSNTSHHRLFSRLTSRSAVIHSFSVFTSPASDGTTRPPFDSIRATPRRIASSRSIMAASPPSSNDQLTGPARRRATRSVPESLPAARVRRDPWLGVWRPVRRQLGDQREPGRSKRQRAEYPHRNSTCSDHRDPPSARTDRVGQRSGEQVADATGHHQRQEQAQPARSREITSLPDVQPKAPHDGSSLLRRRNKLTCRGGSVGDKS